MFVQGGNNRSNGIFVLIATFLFFSGTSAQAQDILGLFLSGDSKSRMIGENPFAGTSSDERLTESSFLTPSVQFLYLYDNVYHETHSDGTQTIVENYSRKAEVIFPLARNSYQPVLGFQVTSSRFTALTDQSRTDGGAFNGDNKRISFSYSMKLSNTIHFGASVGQSYAHPTLLRNYESNIAIQLSPKARFAIRAGNTSFTQLLRLDIAGISGVMPLDYQMQSTQASFQLDYPAVKFSVSGRHGDIISIPDMNREWQTQFLPNGELFTFNGSARIPISETWSALCIIDQENMEGKGRFISRGQSYGSFSNFGYASTSYTFAARYAFLTQGMIEAHFQWKLLSGKLNGSVESWPFVSFFDLPFGQRENFEAAGSFKIWKFHVGSIIPFSDQFSGGIGLTALKLIPQVDIHSWESKFLSYGRRAYQERSLAINYLDLGIVSAGIKADLTSFELSYAINQFIPLKISRKEHFTGEAIGSTASGSSVTSSIQSKGGQFHQMVLSYKF